MYQKKCAGCRTYRYTWFDHLCPLKPGHRIQLQRTGFLQGWICKGYGPEDEIRPPSETKYPSLEEREYLEALGLIYQEGDYYFTWWYVPADISGLNFCKWYYAQFDKKRVVHELGGRGAGAYNVFM